MVFESDRTGKQVVWTKDLETGKERMLTDVPSLFNLSRISPDGERIAFMMISHGQPGVVHVVPFSGGTPTPLGESCTLLGWTPDSRRLLCQSPDNGPRPYRLDFLDPGTGFRTALAQHVKAELSYVNISPDGQWMSFFATRPGLSEGYFIARAWDNKAPSEEEWIPSQGSEWSNDGNRVWGINGQDGFRCIWTQRRDPKTKRMIGDFAPVYHFHNARRSLTNVVFSPRLSAAGDKLVFTQGELTGNVWMAEFRDGGEQ
jgi:eukaryotic-like serine/threonine-protein kinase